MKSEHGGFTVIGITGQTGAGKSTVCDYMKQCGLAVVNADAVAREVMGAGSPCLRELAEVFGADILRPDGSLDRKCLARRAFASKEATGQLNRVTHPHILRRSEEYLRAAGEQGIRAAILDAPQLFESGGEVLCDKVIAVTAPESVRLSRIMQRDGITEAEARLRIGAQHPEAYYTQQADYTIDGSADVRDVQRQTECIIRGILEQRK